MRALTLFLSVCAASLLVPGHLCAQRSTPTSSELAVLTQGNAPASILKALSERDFAKAQREAEALAVKSPQDASIRNIEGATFLLTGSLGQAEAAFQKSLQLNPQFLPAYRNLGIALWHEHHTADAARMLRIAHTGNPNDGLTNLYLGQVYFSARDCTNAVKAFESSGPFLFQAPAPMFMNVVCDAQTGNTTGAALLLTRLRTESQIPPRDLFQFAMQTAQNGEYRLAFLTLKLVPPGFPDNYTYAFDTALAAYQTSNYDGARAVLGKLASNDKATPESMDLLGNVLEEQGISEKKPQLVKKAYDTYRQGIYKDPHYLLNFIDIARLALKLGNYRLGESLLTEGLAANPGAPQLLLERGMAYAFDGHTAQAAEDFSSVRAVKPHDALPYMAEGILDIQGSRYGQAIVDLREGIEESKQPNAWLYFLLAKALYNQGRLTPANKAEMRHALQKTIQLNPKFKEAYALAGLVWMKSKDYVQAERYLESARQLDPANSHYVYELATIKKLQHQPNAAARYFRIFEHLETTNNQARMRKYFMKILVEQRPGRAMQEARNAD